MLRSLRTLRSFPRIKDIALILGKHGFHQVAEALQAPIRTRLRRIFKWEPRQTIQQPERLRRVLEELGPTFIKFGQLLSTRPDLLPPEYIEELGKLQDDVQPASFAEIQAVLEEEFHATVAERFRRIEATPLAAASIAQVHRATTLAGDDVVVKVRKRGLEKLIHQDLQVLALFAEFLAGWRGLRLFDPEGVIRLFERSIRRELDFDHERHNLARIRENLGADAAIYVPQVFPALSRQGVLTMEYLPGEKLSSLRQRPPLDPEQGKEIATRIAICMLKQLFEHGVYHADPHPGNFILMADGRVGLIDFGNVGKCTPEVIDDLLFLLSALVRRDYPETARWLLRRAPPPRDLEVQDLALELMDTLDPFYGLSLAEIQIGGLFRSLFGMVLRHDITVPAAYVHVGRTFITLEGVVRLCSPNLELLPAIQPYMTEVLRRRWSPERLLRDLRAEASEILTALRSYPSNLAEVLARAASGRLRLESRIPELGNLERRLEQGASRIPLAILICGLLISSTILLFAPGAAESTLRAILGASGFGLGLLLALRMALRG